MERFQKERAFLKNHELDHETDQEKGLPQPPLFKAAMRETSIELPKNFEDLKLSTPLDVLFRERKTRRKYTQNPITILELSFLIWAAQGVRGRRGKHYASLRIVPSGGARHPFEMYLDLRHVEGLENGLYHYLPETHAIEFLGVQHDERADQSLQGQTWGLKASVIFYFSIVPYRCEWRYDEVSHKIAMVDLGHIGQNLYLAAEALNLGTCGIGAIDREVCDAMLELDGTEEFSIYAQPVGTVSSDSDENEIYRFVEEQDL